MDEGDEEGGLCFDGLEVALGCTVGLLVFTLYIYLIDLLGGHWIWGQAEHGLDDLHGGR